MNRSYSNLARFAPLIIGLLIAGVMVLRGCQKGPLGRNQLILTTPDQELQLGRSAYQEILSNERGKVLPGDEPIVGRVREVGERLRRVADDPEFRKRLNLSKDLKMEWQFNVIYSKQINAFCLPGGKVAVYTGILNVCRTDAGLAVVMGHEIGHALARHGGERISQNQVADIVKVAVATSLGNMDPQQRAQIIGLLGAGVQVGVLLPFSRSQESEADHIGVLMMAQAGYDPNEAIEFWQRMNQATGSGGGGWLSTHPDHGTRAADLRKWVAEEAYAIYDRSPHASNQRLPGPSERIVPKSGRPASPR